MFIRKFLTLFLCILMVLVITGCNTHSNITSDDNTSFSTVETSIDSSQNSVSKTTTEAAIPYPLEMYFSSGAGAWYTSITINADGSFTGEHHDSDMGAIGEDYPNGTISECKFSGKFNNIRQINHYTFAFTLESITTEEERGYTYIEDGVRYETSYPYGLNALNGQDFSKEYLLYTPECPVSQLSEEFLSWWPLRYGDTSPKSLSLYGLYNTETETGFFTRVNL